MKSKHIFIIIGATILTFAFVWVRLKIVSISYEIHDLQAKERTLREECNTLSFKIHEARSPRRLEGIARSNFKMHPPRTDQIIVLRDR